VKSSGEEVAIKNLDLESLSCNIEEIVREAHTMRSLNHPNLLPLYCSFVHENHLWMVMPYIHGGSVLNIMRFRYPDGLEEPVIATIMKSVLKALDYLHKHGIIHRDIKAGNVLLDWDGHVMLADFGVAAKLERGGSWGNRMISRNTFVGTPCWMAPEVMEPERGYDWRADIWSFGITLLELAHGHAPFARLPPMKVLMMTLNNPPPTLDQSPDSKKHFSKAMRDIVAKCLVKTPSERPTAAQLLDHKFFKTAHDAHYLHRHVLEGLPPVPQRVEMMKQAQGLGQKDDKQEKEILASQQEYRRGMSSWNFDVDALKKAAAEGAAREEAERRRLETIREQGQQKDDQPSDLSTSPTKVPLEAGVSRAVSQRPAAIKEHGRFKVYEGDEPPPFSPSGGEGFSMLEEAMAAKGGISASSSTVDELEPEAKEAKRKGRFVYVEAEDGKTRLAKMASNVSLDRMPPPSSGAPGVGVLHFALKDLLESAQQQHESLREMTAAVADAEKGKYGALNAYLTQRRRFHSPAEYDSLKAEINELREENAKLREQLASLSTSGK
jgi:serine/threonine-protein kinase OSR1/STK39